MLHSHRKAWMSIWGIYHLSQQKLCILPPVLMLINHQCRLASALLTLKLPLLRLFSQCITHLQRLYLAWRQSMLHQAITRPPHLLPSPYSQWTIHLQLNLSKQLWRRYQRQTWKTKTPRFHLNLKSLQKTQKLKWIVRRLKKSGPHCWTSLKRWMLRSMATPLALRKWPWDLASSIFALCATAWLVQLKDI